MAEGDRDVAFAREFGELTAGMKRVEEGQGKLIDSVTLIHGRLDDCQTAHDEKHSTCREGLMGQIADIKQEHAVDKTKLAFVVTLITIVVGSAVAAIFRAWPGLFTGGAN